jgi:FAD/FMN-containing dehydrogenase
MSSPTLGWGRFPDFPQTVNPVFWPSEVGGALRGLADRFGETLAYGNGRSYGDSCLASSDQVIGTRSLNRFIAADWQKGVIVAEAGVTLGELMAVCVTRGWLPPVLPGTKHVTLGGALANDVHGKNHHVRGTFGRHVRRFGLVRSDAGAMECSPDRNADLFRATIGGLGVTGVIVWIELALMPIESSNLVLTEARFDSLDEFFALSRELDPLHEYAVSWMDCLAGGTSAGRGIYTVADHSKDGPLEAPDDGRKLRVPLTPPVSLINGFSVRALNSFLYRKQSRRRVIRQLASDAFFFPLDGLLEWNRCYGPRGFQQYQCVLPEGHASDATRAVLQAIGASGRGSFLMVVKRCGELASPGLMSFPLPGISIAVDFSQHEDLARSLFPRLDAIVREAQGRLYPAKDAHMSGEDFRRAYPGWERVQSLRDPALSSRFWRRVTAT